MKKTVIFLCLFLLSLSLFAKGIQQETESAGEQDNISYAIGMVIGADLLHNGLTVNYTAFAEGLKAAMEGGAKFSQSDAEEIVQDALEKAMNAQSEQNRETETEFFVKNGMREDVITTPSGLQYEIITEGSGPKPSSSDSVQVHYEGSLVDGTVFDSTRQRGELAEIPLEMVIPGWAEGIQLMNVGSIYRLYIPSVLAYGERGAGPVIPPYSPVIFLVELLGIVGEPSDEAMEETAEEAATEPVEEPVDETSGE